MTHPSPVPIHPRCKAHNVDGSPCGAYPIRGGTVCGMHGGRAKHVRAAAEARIAAMVDPALGELHRLIRHADTDGVKLAAIKDVLDRAGLKATVTVQSDQQITIRVIDEPQPIVLEQIHRLNGYPDGRTDS